MRMIKLKTFVTLIAFLLALDSVTFGQEDFRPSPEVVRAFLFKQFKQQQLHIKPVTRVKLVDILAFTFAQFVFHSLLHIMGRTFKFVNNCTSAFTTIDEFFRCFDLKRYIKYDID